MNALRQRYTAARAAGSGDRAAFDVVWHSCRMPLRAVVLRTLRDVNESVTEDDVTEVHDRARASSFEELKDKPADWSVYGWMSWIAQREALRTMSQVR